MDEFKNKRVLITGAGSGIGRATALKFAAARASVVLIGRSKANLEQTYFEIKKHSPCDVSLHIFDLSDEEMTQKFWNQIDDFDIAVNNAGVEGAIGQITDLKLEDFDHLMSVNLRSLWHCLREQIRILKMKNKGGTIVNLSSLAGLFGIPHSALYSASKHAVNGLTKSLALEQIKNGIRINAVCPGGIETPMLERVFDGNLNIPAQLHPIGRNGSPQEIAEVIFWLASKNSSFMVGQCVPVDGGRSS